MKVIDLSGGVAGPSCAMMLAQHGADVIKVETPHDGGDWSRILGRTYEDHSAFSVYGTLGKRSVAVDLKTPEGKEILWRLMRGADVFMEGLRPGTIKRYGFGYDAVSAQGAGDSSITRSPALGRPDRWRRGRRWIRCCRRSSASSTRTAASATTIRTASRSR